MFTLIPGKLTLNDIYDLLKNPQSIQLSSDSYHQIHRSKNVVDKVIENKKIVYGINTGFGSLANQIIPEDTLALLQKNIILSHACGVGKLMREDTVKLMLLLKINALSQGYSGVSTSLIEQLIALYNHDILPCIPKKGSVGASGDLAPLAHMSMALMGEGDVIFKGEVVPALTALNQIGLKPYQLGPKEGLALINGLQASQVFLLQAYFMTQSLFETAIISGAMSTDAARGSSQPFDEKIHIARGHQAQIDVALMLSKLLEDSEIMQSHQSCKKVQDPYCLRCQPQVMGAILHHIRHVGEILQVEINSVTDNPLVFSESNTIISGGNFHGEMVAMASDVLALAIAEIGAISERRIAMLVDSNFSGLPPFLTDNPGINSGFMIMHVTAAALASDNKAVAHPHSVDSIPTSANQEDHVSMATNAARRLWVMNDNVASILSIELLAAYQGLTLLKPLKTSEKLDYFYKKIQSKIENFNQDRFFGHDMAILKADIMSGNFLE